MDNKQCIQLSWDIKPVTTKYKTIKLYYILIQFSVFTLDISIFQYTGRTSSAVPDYTAL